MAAGITYMRGLCITVNVLLLIFGGFILVVGLTYTLKQAPELERQSASQGVLVLNVFGPLTVLFSLVGTYAAFTDRKLILVLYAVFLTTELIALIIIAAPLIKVQPKMGDILERKFNAVVPLHSADLRFQKELKKLQARDQCCGLLDYSDWEGQIPASCLCPQQTPNDNSSDSPCRTVEAQTTHNETSGESQELQVHSKPCGPILKRHMDFLIKAMIGFISAFATIMVASIVLSLALGLESVWRTSPSSSGGLALNDSSGRVKHQLSPQALPQP